MDGRSDAAALEDGRGDGHDDGVRLEGAGVRSDDDASAAIVELGGGGSESDVGVPKEVRDDGIEAREEEFVAGLAGGISGRK